MKALNWDTVPVEPVTAEISRQVVTGQNEMMARVLLKRGAIVPTHSHVSEQITYILEGALRLWIGEPEEEVTVRPGSFVVIPPNVPHRAEASGVGRKQFRVRVEADADGRPGRAAGVGQAVEAVRGRHRDPRS